MNSSSVDQSNARDAKTQRLAERPTIAAPESASGEGGGAAAVDADVVTELRDALSDLLDACGPDHQCGDWAWEERKNARDAIVKAERQAGRSEP